MKRFLAILLALVLTLGLGVTSIFPRYILPCV